MVSVIHIFAGLCCLCFPVWADTDVRVPPSIMQTKASISFYYRIYKSVYLRCEATGTPSPTYEWTLNGNPLDMSAWRGQRYNISSTGRLKIRRMYQKYHGHYQCKASNPWGTAVIDYFVKPVVLYWPVEAIREPNMTAGQPYWINPYSNVEKNRPKPTIVTWTLRNRTSYYHVIKDIEYDGRILTDDIGSLYFTSLRKADGTDPVDLSYYVMHVTNRLTTRVRGGAYTILTVNDGDLSDKAPSMMNHTASPYIAVKGSAVRMQCVFGGIPEPQVVWSPMPVGRSSTEMFGTLLVIDPVEPSDAGTYTCVGTNRVGSATETVNVVVEYKPEFAREPVNINATEGATVTYDCGVLSGTHPSVTVEWFINGVELKSDSLGPRTSISGDYGQLLTFTDVCRDCPDGGTDLKVVRCNATNKHGSAVADVYLNVLKRTAITRHPVDQHISEEEEVVFHCEAASDPSTPVTVSWDKEGIPITTNQVLGMVVSDTSLTINLEGLSVDDKKNREGVYRCTADNGYSQASEVARLSIQRSQEQDLVERWLDLFMRETKKKRE